MASDPAHGEQGEFAELFDRCFDDVYSYVAFRVAPDAEAAKDITQDVFLAGLQSFSTFRHDGPALNWLRSIARRKVADHFRARASEARRRKSWPDLSVSATPSNALSTPETALRVSLAMRRISARHAEFLEEKYLDGRPVEIARRRGISEKAAESVLSRAREAFRCAYETSGDKEDMQDDCKSLP